MGRPVTRRPGEAQRRDVGEGRFVARPVREEADPADGEAGFGAGVRVTGARIEGGKHAGVAGEAELRSAVLDGVDLSGSRLQPVELVDSTLRGVDLSNAVWQRVDARRTELVDCRGTGLRLSIDVAADLWVSDSRFDYAVLRLDRVRGLAVFSGCSFREAEFAGALDRVVFDGCDLAGVEFAAGSAAGCDLRSSSLVGARGLATLRGARVTVEQTLTVADRLAAELGLSVEET